MAHTGSSSDAESGSVSSKHVGLHHNTCTKCDEQFGAGAGPPTTSTSLTRTDPTARIEERPLILSSSAPDEC